MHIYSTTFSNNYNSNRWYIPTRGEKKHYNMCDKSTYWPSFPPTLSLYVVVVLCKQSSTQPNILASSSHIVCCWVRWWCQRMIHKINKDSSVFMTLKTPLRCQSQISHAFSQDISHNFVNICYYLVHFEWSNIISAVYL